MLARFQQYKSFRDSNALVRSFLVAEDHFKKIIGTSISQINSKNNQLNHIVDDTIYYNQFGIHGSRLDELESNIKRSSLITYGDNIDIVNLTTSGQYKDITELSRKIFGIPLHVWPIGEEWDLACHITSFLDYLSYGFLDNYEASKLIAQLGYLMHDSFYEGRRIGPIRQINENTDIKSLKEKRINIKNTATRLANEYEHDAGGRDPRTEWSNNVAPHYRDICKKKEFQSVVTNIRKDEKEFYDQLLFLAANERSNFRPQLLELVMDILNDVLTYKGFPENCLNVLLQT